MFLAGDEFGNTQFGNNNSYCQDNEVSWLDWSLLEKNRELFEFFKFMIHFRKKHTVIRKKLPETKIFINSIFPVQKWRVEEEPLFEHIAEYNEALRAMCDKLQIAYVDNTELVTDRYYEADGMHFKSDFYPVWARRMAEFSAL